MISLRDFLDLDVLVILILAFCLWGSKFIQGFNQKHARYLMMAGLAILTFETLREIWVAHHQNYQKYY